MNKTLKTCTIEELLETLEAYCFAYAHHQTKKSAIEIDKCKDEIKRRIEEKHP